MKQSACVKVKLQREKSRGWWILCGCVQPQGRRGQKKACFVVGGYKTRTLGIETEERKKFLPKNPGRRGGEGWSRWGLIK